MDLLEIMLNRRSVRTYTGEKIEDEKLEMILKAGLAAPSGRGRRPWEFIVVRDKDTLACMSESRKCGAGMLTGADCAIVVVADEEKTDVWTEDCSIAMAYMHLMADSLGVGSCWGSRSPIVLKPSFLWAFQRSILRQERWKTCRMERFTRKNSKGFTRKN